MNSFGSLFDLDFYRTSSEVSIVVMQSVILAFFLSFATALLSYRAALRKASATLFWCGNFSLAYAVWNLLYLLSLRPENTDSFTFGVSLEFSQRAHLIVSVLLPQFAHRFFSLFFGPKRMASRIPLLSAISVIVLLFIPLENNYRFALLGTGIVVFSMFSSLCYRLWKLYRTTDDLKIKTRSFFVVVGLTVCTFFSVVGQIRAENIVRAIPLPFIGNILTAVFGYFVYQMAMNPRLREIRELMLRGIRVMFLTAILSVIFLSLLAWVGSNNPELFIFNTFIASFIILNILEPLRIQMDSFFLRRFIVDRYEFEELLKRLPKRLRSTRAIDQMASTLVTGIRESGRIYQTALFLWDPVSKDYRLKAPSNLNFKNTLTTDDPWIQYFKNNRSPLILEQDQDLPEELRNSLRDMHSHMVLPLFREKELLGIWALRTSLRSTNPYTSFSDNEIELLIHVSEEIVSQLDQVQHFESQERQERLAALGEMSAALAHEIRNPLGALHGAAHLLKTSKTLAGEEDKECVDIVSKEVERMQKTVDQYLSFARRSEEPIPVDLSTLVRKVIHDIRRKSEQTRTQIHEAIEPHLPQLNSDPLKVEQVLFNLVQNACEAFSKNIWVSVKFAPASKEQVEISVKDDGPGIPASVLPNIFTPLFTTKKAGSGLGLPICKKIIESLGGSVSVESQLKVGTTFHLRLPFGSATTIPTQKAPEPLQPSAES